ncbi:hypothetical protein ZWY2020_026045 [Hordeum vulgare]|nr:hypothetical protein ZWY2020_026045 [Hordeum vulgare]
MGVCGVLADIATVAQLSGLHAVMLIALAARLLRIPQCKAECAKLEGCARKLHTLLDMATRHPVVAGLVVGELVEATGLVTSYHGSTLWQRIRTGSSMETQLRDMRSRLNCLCGLVLYVHANLLTTSYTFDTRDYHLSDASHGAETSDTSDSQRYKRVGQGGADNQSENNEARRI